VLNREEDDVPHRREDRGERSDELGEEDGRTTGCQSDSSRERRTQDREERTDRMATRRIMGETVSVLDRMSGMQNMAVKNPTSTLRSQGEMHVSLLVLLVQ
jgi:hypothetical protein